MGFLGRAHNIASIYQWIHRHQQMDKNRIRIKNRSLLTNKWDGSQQFNLFNGALVIGHMLHHHVTGTSSCFNQLNNKTKHDKHTRIMYKQKEESERNS